MNLLLRMVDGFALTADVYTAPRKYQRAVKQGFATDAERLRGDVQRVGKDVKLVLSRVDHYNVESRDGQPSDTCAGAIAER